MGQRDPGLEKLCILHKKAQIFTVLRIWIRDPVLSLAPGSGIGKSGSGMNIPDHFFDSLETVFWVRILRIFDADPDPGSGIFLTLDPGWTNSAPGSGINIPDPHHWIFIFTLVYNLFYWSFSPKKLALNLSHVGEPYRCSCAVRAVKDLLSGTQGNPLYEWKNVNVIRNKVNKSHLILHVVLGI